MVRFNCDYSEGAHPSIMERLLQTNMLQTAGYGEDDYCEEARKLIRSKFGAEEADVHFLVGGTQANLTVMRQLFDHIKELWHPLWRISMYMKQDQ